VEVLAHGGESTAVIFVAADFNPRYEAGLHYDFQQF